MQFESYAWECKKSINEIVLYWMQVFCECICIVLFAFVYMKTWAHNVVIKEKYIIYLNALMLNKIIIDLMKFNIYKLTEEGFIYA